MPKLRLQAVWAPELVNTHPNILKFQHFFYLCSNQNWKCKILTFGSDFGIATFRTILAKRFWDTSPFSLGFCMEFAANLQYTLINTALTRSPPPPNKDEVHKVYKICKGCLTCNTQHCVQGGGGSTTITFSSPTTQSVPNVLTWIVAMLSTCSMRQ